MKTTIGATRFFRAVLPAFLLAVSVGQIYAFTVFSDPIARVLADDAAQAVQLRAQVQFAFSLGIFFLGMGAAFFGKIVERNIRLSTLVGTGLFLSGLLVTALGIKVRSLALIYIGYGFLLGTGTGVIYISPVKTMMLWFPNAKAIAAAVPIISFGLGSSLCTLLYKGFGFTSRLFTLQFAGFEVFDIATAFVVVAGFYAVPMVVSAMILRKPRAVQTTFAHSLPDLEFSYRRLAMDSWFVRVWLFMFLNISCGLCLIPLAKQLQRQTLVAIHTATTKNSLLATTLTSLSTHPTRTCTTRSRSISSTTALTCSQRSRSARRQTSSASSSLLQRRTTFSSQSSSSHVSLSTL